MRGPVKRMQCPKCGTAVQVSQGDKPHCPSCGFGAPKARVVEAEPVESTQGFSDQQEWPAQNPAPMQATSSQHVPSPYPAQPTPHAPQGGVSAVAPGYAQPWKSKTAAGLLAIFLGGIGAHKFYMQRYGQGILYLLFVWTYIPALVGFIEGIIYLFMTDEEFNAKYFPAHFGVPAVAAAGAQAQPQPAQRTCLTCGMGIDVSFNACPHCGTVQRKGVETPATRS